MYTAGKWAIPLFSTAMLGTFTYPRAVAIARSNRLLGLRNFYAIHVAIAPFLSYIHLNFYSLVASYFRAKLMELDWRDQMAKESIQRYKAMVDGNFDPSTVITGAEPFGMYFHQI